MKPKKMKKLTLIELIIAVMVLGLLTALAMPQFVGTKANADVATFKNDIDVLHKAVDEMYVREDKLPLGEKVTVTDAKLLDAIYASGDSGNFLYKVDLSQSKKYHMDLKTPVDADNYFIYSKETGRIFYTNGMIDGDKKVHYTMDYIGVSGLKLGSEVLVNGMNIPVSNPMQTISGSVPLTAIVEIKVNGTSVPVTYENVTFDHGRNIMAGVKMKAFTSEVSLSEGKNVITLKSGNSVTNFKIHLSDTPITPEEPTGEPTTEPTTEAPVVKPVAVISMTPEQAITTTTNIVWGYENSTAAEGRSITAAEWDGKQDIYTAEGIYTIRLRVKDSAGIWSDWTEKTITVNKSIDRLSQIDASTIYMSNNISRYSSSHDTNTKNIPFTRVSENELRRYTLSNSSPAYLQRVTYDKDMNVISTLSYTKTGHVYSNYIDFSVFRYKNNDYLVYSEGKLLYLIKFDEVINTFEKTLIKDLNANNDKGEKVSTIIDGDTLYIFYDWNFDKKEYLIKYDMNLKSIISSKQVTLNNATNVNGMMSGYESLSMTQDTNFIYLAFNTQYSDTSPGNIIVLKISKDTLLTDSKVIKSFSGIKLYQPEIFFDGTGQLWLLIEENFGYQNAEGLYTLNFVSNTMTREISVSSDLIIRAIEVMPDGSVRVYRNGNYWSYFLLK